MLSSIQLNARTETVRFHETWNMIFYEMKKLWSFLQIGRNNGVKNIEMNQFQEEKERGGSLWVSLVILYAFFMVLCHNYGAEKYVNENIAYKKWQTMAQTPTTNLIKITSWKWNLIDCICPRHYHNIHMEIDIFLWMENKVEVNRLKSVQIFTSVIKCLRWYSKVPLMPTAYN